MKGELTWSVAQISYLILCDSLRYGGEIRRLSLGLGLSQCYKVRSLIS